MMLYLFAPAYMELIKRHPIYRWLPVVMIMWCILVQYVTPIHQAVGHLEIFWSRVPIFFIGINMGEMVRQKQTLDGASIWMIWLMFLMTLLASIFLEQEKHGMFPLFLERMLYIPLTITSILLLNRIFRRTPRRFNKGFMFVGALRQVLSAPYPLRAEIHRTASLGLLAYFLHLHRHHPACGMDSEQDSRMDF